MHILIRGYAWAHDIRIELVRRLWNFIARVEDSVVVGLTTAVAADVAAAICVTGEESVLTKLHSSGILSWGHPSR